MSDERLKRLTMFLEGGLRSAPAYWAENDRVIRLVEEALSPVNEVLAEKFGRAGSMKWPRVKVAVASGCALATGAPLRLIIRGASDEYVIRVASDEYEFASIEPLLPVGWGTVEAARVRWADDAGSLGEGALHLRDWVWETSRGAEPLVSIFEGVLGTPAVAALLERAALRFRLAGLE